MGGTYLTKREILKLAGYVDFHFEDSVYEAFEALAEGKTVVACKIAANKVIVHEQMLMKRPAQQIEKLLPQLGSDIVDAVDTYIKAMSSNTKATNVERERTLQSIRYVLNKLLSETTGHELARAGQLHAALELIAKKERTLARNDRAKA